MDVMKLKKHVLMYFKMSGYDILSETAMILVDKIKDLSEADQEKTISEVHSHIMKSKMKSSNLEKHYMEAAVKECFQSGFSDTESIFSVINAFDIPHFKYQKENKKFILDHTPKRILSSATSRSEYIRNRYNILMQRILRHELFAKNVNENIRTTTTTTKKFNLKLAENLLSSSRVDEVVMLGLLSKFKEGKFYLEDPSGAIPIDLTSATFHAGLFTEGSFVIAEGKYNDGILKVSGIGCPPPEPSQSSRAYFGSANSWGGPSKTILKYSKKLLEYERLNLSGTIIFLSDCWLDDAGVMDSLKKLMIGFDESPPIAIVLMGPFSKSKDNYSNLKSKFSALGDVINTTFTLKNETEIILVPDMEDPSAPNILPRPPIPEPLVADLRKKCKKITLATNPCRLQYCTQQITVCRLDLVRKLCRNTIKFPSTGQLEDHIAKTLICQGTLTPFTQMVLPTYWDFDTALCLYPLPDLLVIGDNSSDFQTTHIGCSVVNTGSFPKSKYSFKLYLPATGTIEDSQIPDDDEVDG